MLEDIKKDARERMGKCVQNFQADLKKLRTGRAHPSLIEHLKVDLRSKKGGGNDSAIARARHVGEGGREQRASNAIAERVNLTLTVALFAACVANLMLVCAYL